MLFINTSEIDTLRSPGILAARASAKSAIEWFKYKIVECCMRFVCLTMASTTCGWQWPQHIVAIPPKASRSTEELVKSGTGINKLEEEIRSSQKELELKNSKIADLSTQISALIVERDNSYLSINNEMQKQYNDLKSYAEEAD
ncbi:hypothetical protein QQ045_016545 [Rhodiola kirilowii]